MDLTTIIQVAIGMIFVWIILAVITSQVQDWIASLLKWRAELLESTILQMLGNPNLKDKLYEHPLIKGLWTNNGQRKPGGIPKDKFALVLFEQLMDQKIDIGEVKNTFDELKKKVANIKDNAPENSELKKFAATMNTLLIGIEEKENDAAHAITEARTRVESWFNDSMDRLGGAFRRRMQIIGLVVGITIAAVLNVDTGAIMTTLWKDPIVRQAIAVQASQMQETDIQAGETPSIEEIAQNVEKLNLLSIPVGWSAKTMPTDAGGWVAKIIGILLSGMAGAQGAPYWFDLMKKLVSRGK